MKANIVKIDRPFVSVCRSNAMTTMTKAVETVIKTDGVGRMRTSAVRRESLLDEFERSGMSGTKFAPCPESNIKRLQVGVAKASPLRCGVKASCRSKLNCFGEAAGGGGWTGAKFRRSKSNGIGMGIARRCNFKKLHQNLQLLLIGTTDAVRP